MPAPPAATQLTLDVLRKRNVRDRLSQYVLGDACLPSLGLLQTLLAKDFFCVTRADAALGLVLEWAAGLKLLNRAAETPTVEAYVKGDKAYNPCQRVLGQPATACGVELQPFQVLLVLKDRTMLVCSADHEKYWHTTIVGILPDAVLKGMLATNTKTGPASGRPMCCEWARTKKCSTARCPFAHVMDGRPCQLQAGCQHGQCTIGIPFRIAEWYGWLREEDRLPVIGVATAAGPVVQRIPDALQRARTEPEFRRLLPGFLSAVCPVLPTRKDDESDEHYQLNVRKYLDTLATSIYRKWQRHTGQKRTLSMDNPKTTNMLLGLYPPSWQDMIESCVTKRSGVAQVSADSAMVEPRVHQPYVHQPYAPCLPPAYACAQPHDARPPSPLVVGLRASHLPEPHTAVDGGVVNPLVTSVATDPHPEPVPTSAAAIAVPPPPALTPRTAMAPRLTRCVKKCNTTPSGTPSVSTEVSEMFKSWYPDIDRAKSSTFEATTAPTAAAQVGHC